VPRGGGWSASWTKTKRVVNGIPHKQVGGGGEKATDTEGALKTEAEVFVASDGMGIESNFGATKNGQRPRESTVRGKRKVAY